MLRVSQQGVSTVAGTVTNILTGHTDRTQTALALARNRASRLVRLGIYRKRSGANWDQRRIDLQRNIGTRANGWETDAHHHAGTTDLPCIVVQRYRAVVDNTWRHKLLQKWPPCHRLGIRNRYETSAFFKILPNLGRRRKTANVFRIEEVCQAVRL